jgi:hypothetical protein
MIFHGPPNALWSFWIPSQREPFPTARHEIKFQISVGEIPNLKKEKFPILRELLTIRRRAVDAEHERLRSQHLSSNDAVLIFAMGSSWTLPQIRVRGGAM